MTFYIKSQLTGDWEPWIAAIPVCDNHNQLEGVYRPVTAEQARSSTAAHAEHYSRCVRKFLNGDYPGTGQDRWMAMYRDIASFRMTGAFGEKL